MGEVPPQHVLIRFGVFELDVESGELRKQGVKVRLQEQPLQILQVLLEHPGTVVRREELQRRIWPSNTFVDFDTGLYNAIKKLREALGDSAESPRFIETLSRRGYRFIAAVEGNGDTAAGKVASATQVSRKAMRSRFIGGIAAAIVMLLMAVAIFWFIPRQPTPSQALPYPMLRRSASSRAIAVLPLQNAGSNREMDFLRLALADEVATALSRVPSFSIRPFATTSQFSSPGVDLQRAGHDMSVASIVTGHFLTEGNQLEVTLEAVDVATNRSLWRETVNVTASDSIAMREQVTLKVRQGLIPALGGSSLDSGIETHPKSEEAYDLYLRSIAVSHDVAPNKEAVKMLERTVGIDPGYAPAWEALGLRYYFDATYADDGERTLTRSDTADERALALDPSLIFAAAQLITNRADEGNVGNAYAQASALVKDRPESAQAHFARAYVQRYAGLLDESARECDTALALDGGNYQFRSCALTFIELDRTQRAMDFVHLDPDSEWAASRVAYILLQDGKLAEAKQRISHATTSPVWGRDLLEACLDPSQVSEMDGIAHRAETAALAANDAETRYLIARLLAYCNQKETSLRLLKGAIKHYCAYTALETDPLLAKLRGSSEFARLRSAAKECQDEVLAEQRQSLH